MYLKLMVRGLLRHRKSGKRLFVLLALCSAAVLFFLGFRASFSQRYQQLGIDLSTSHLQIVPADSPKLAEDGNCTDHRQGLVLVNYSDELERFLHSVPHLESAMLAVETKGSVFTLEGDPVGSAITLVGVDPQSFERTLPGVKVLEGAPGLAWNKGMFDISVYRPRPELGEVVKDNDRFVRENFRPKGEEWESFKQGLVRDIPVLFQSAAGAINDETFLMSLNGALNRADLPRVLPQKTKETYDYRIDDALAALDVASPGSSAGMSGSASSPLGSSSHLKVLRKRLLQAVYPDVIRPVRDTITLDFPYTLAVPPARGNDPVERPYVFPIKLTAYVERMPIFSRSYYIDARALRDRLGLKEREGTNVYIRLSSNADTPVVKKTIEGWLSAHELKYVVKDYAELGKLFGSVALGFNFILLILIVLFVAIVMIFIVNSIRQPTSTRLPPHATRHQFPHSCRDIGYRGPRPAEASGQGQARRSAQGGRVMLTPKLAFRNLLAHGQRNRVTFIAVGLVSCIIFLFLAFSDGELENLSTGMVALNEPSSDIVVYTTGFKAAYDQDEDWKRLSAA